MIGIDAACVVFVAKDNAANVPRKLRRFTPAAILTSRSLSESPRSLIHCLLVQEPGNPIASWRSYPDLFSDLNGNGPKAEQGISGIVNELIRLQGVWMNLRHNCGHP